MFGASPVGCLPCLPYRMSQLSHRGDSLPGGVSPAITDFTPEFIPAQAGGLICQTKFQLKTSLNRPWNHLSPDVIVAHLWSYIC